MRSVFFRALTAAGCILQLAGADSPRESPESEFKRCILESGRLYEEGRFGEAERVLSQAVGHAERLPPGDPRLPTTLHSLGFLYQERGKPFEAKACYLRAIHSWDALGPERRHETSMSIDNLIGIYMEVHDYRAEKLIQKRLAEMEKSPSWRDHAILYNMRASLAFGMHHYGEAEKEFRRSLELWTTHPAGQDRNIAIVEMNLSALYQATTRYGDALDVGTRAVAILEKADPTGRPVLAWALDNVAFVLNKLNRTTEAERAYDRALVTAIDVFGPDHRIIGRIMLEYSAVLRRLQRKTEAKAFSRQAQAILGQSAPPNATVDMFELSPVVR